ncbi:hypothetical protein D8674_035517 [Pyrus ussuriensis x Pyrus communis]|uniref:Uncharacterized protein n=1 Tax=Pyrus ussuriensis x Pyrus communis TaxID=2448454 RepID=A0A5N5GH66_9ROSA|nr:hypothetical protein D8674_035517 [Pyrus ussuriensis x Pyrus communis]
MAKAYIEFRFDIENLVRRDYSAEFKSWKKVHEELNKSMLRELSVHWDVDETDEKQRIYVDGLSSRVSGSGGSMCLNFLFIIK